MAALSFLTRTKRGGLLLNQTEHGLQLARIGRLDEKPLVVDAFTELPLGDDDAIGRWIEATFTDRGPGYLTGYCGFHPNDRVLLRRGWPRPSVFVRRSVLLSSTELSCRCDSAAPRPYWGKDRCPPRGGNFSATV